MTLENFISSEIKQFRIDSGNVLIADPYMLGYPFEFEETIDRLAETGGHPGTECPFLTFMPHGFLIVDDTDGIWNVYREEQGFQLVGRQPSNEDEMTKLKDYRGKEFLLNASVDTCNLLIGDAERFVTMETERVPRFSYDTNEKEQMKAFQLKQVASTSKQLINVPKGIYTAIIDPNAGTVLVQLVHE